MQKKEEQDLRDRTKAFALRIVRMFSALPKTTEAQVLAKQLLRSGTQSALIIEKRFARGQS
jgi:four helix bundle protein